MASGEMLLKHLDSQVSPRWSSGMAPCIFDDNHRPCGPGINLISSRLIEIVGPKDGTIEWMVVVALTI